ncbi:MAG: protein phosphatase CheZ [Rhodospirillales bacterium]|nr:protein phosphatase CheZ [Rhodospirillales bacterium]MCW8862812.1 protein phosphatase CheZ [Rhodospirillales bacterium]MCW8951901.1 protein phosphatase CheZ [Rhodospirillales bacterium]MCW8970656.1 protein phosphatase CheZ [Rhodospirillales bacterium]MCW9002901.1 protein phosphatase CheZ [Rhodospirillales bacterium]
MAGGKGSSDLSQRLAAFKDKHGDTVRVDELGEFVGSLVDAATDDLLAADRKLFEEVEALALFIQSAKKEIAALRPDDVKDKFIPSATDELDAIIEATANATNEIMDAVEIVEGVMDAVEGTSADMLGDATTKIYEACTFQDITGQRITKVVKALKDIEARVDGLLGAFGDEIEKHASVAPKPGKKKKKGEITDEDLLEGPQLPSSAKNQAEIDALLASFE